jgi:hypothetical protein
MQAAFSIVESVGEETEPDIAQWFGGRVAPSEAHLTADRAQSGVKGNVHADGAELVRRVLSRDQRLGHDVGERIDDTRDGGCFASDSACWIGGVPG